MAYPAVPQRRIEYDIDGTVARNINATSGAYYGTCTQAELSAINDANTSDGLFSGNNPPGYNGGVGATPYRVGALYTIFTFPEPMDITHILAMYANNTFALAWSADSTDGIDGTWTSINLDTNGNRQTSFEPGPQFYRDGTAAKLGPPAVPATITNCRHLRMYHTWNDGNYYVTLLHLYGYPTGKSAGTGVEALRIWHPSTDNWIHYNTDLNLGAITQGSYASFTFRVKNVGSVSRSNCTVTAPSQTDESAIPSGTQFSTDNATWFSSVNLGTLAAGAVSSVVYCRMPTAASTGLTPHSQRIVATGT